MEFRKGWEPAVRGDSSSREVCAGSGRLSNIRCRSATKHRREAAQSVVSVKGIMMTVGPRLANALTRVLEFIVGGGTNFIYAALMGRPETPKIGGYANRMRRIGLLGLSVILAVVAVIGLMRAVREHPANWARALQRTPMSESPEIDLEKALKSAGDHLGPKQGATVPLAEFVQGNGRRIRVILIEGQFFDTIIQPSNISRNLGNHILLISSVDENRSSKGDLSGPITKGCSLPIDDVTQQLGRASITQCKGAYRDGGNIEWVGRLSPIVETLPNAEVRPCWERYGLNNPETDYQTCVSNALTDSFLICLLKSRTNGTAPSMLWLFLPLQQGWGAHQGLFL